MTNIQKINDNGSEEISVSSFDFTLANYNIGIENLKILSPGQKSPQPELKTRAELRATMGDDPFWTAAVQWALRRGFWAVKEEARV